MRIRRWRTQSVTLTFSCPQWVESGHKVTALDDCSWPRPDGLLEVVQHEQRTFDILSPSTQVLPHNWALSLVVMLLGQIRSHDEGSNPIFSAEQNQRHKTREHRSGCYAADPEPIEGEARTKSAG